MKRDPRAGLIILAGSLLLAAATPRPGPGREGKTDPVGTVETTVAGAWKLSLSMARGAFARGGDQGGRRPGGAEGDQGGRRPGGAGGDQGGRRPGGGGRRQGGGFGGMMQPRVRLQQEGDKVTGVSVGASGKETPLENVVFKDGNLSFRLAQEMRGAKLNLDFTGKVTGDKMTGVAKLALPARTVNLNFEGERVGMTTADLAGTWKVKVPLKDGSTVEPTLKLVQNGSSVSGVYTGEQGDTPIANALVFGNELTFDVSRERNGNTYRLHYQGRVTGETLKGSVRYDFDGITGSIDFDGKRPDGSSVQK